MNGGVHIHGSSTLIGTPTSSRGVPSAHMFVNVNSNMLKKSIACASASPPISFSVPQTSSLPTHLLHPNPSIHSRNNSSQMTINGNIKFNSRQQPSGSMCVLSPANPNSAANGVGDGNSTSTNSLSTVASSPCLSSSVNDSPASFFCSQPLDEIRRNLLQSFHDFKHRLVTMRKYNEKTRKDLEGMRKQLQRMHPASASSQHLPSTPAFAATLTCASPSSGSYPSLSSSPIGNPSIMMTNDSFSTSSATSSSSSSSNQSPAVSPVPSPLLSAASSSTTTTTCVSAASSTSIVSLFDEDSAEDFPHQLNCLSTLSAVQSLYSSVLTEFHHACEKENEEQNCLQASIERVQREIQGMRIRMRSYATLVKRGGCVTEMMTRRQMEKYKELERSEQSSCQFFQPGDDD